MIISQESLAAIKPLPPFPFWEAQKAGDTFSYKSDTLVPEGDDVVLIRKYVDKQIPEKFLVEDLQTTYAILFHL